MKSLKVIKDIASGGHSLVTSFIPLSNFSTSIKEVNFGPIRLSRFEPEEKSFISSSFTNGFAACFSNSELFSIRHKLSYAIRLPVVARHVCVSTPHDQIGHFAAIMTALRLTKEGHVGASNIVTTGEYNSQFQSFDYGSPRFSGKDYRLERHDLPLCRRMFSDLVKEGDGKLKKLAVGLRRFNLSYTRDRAEDRIIDLTICLESCVLAGLKDELRYRLAVRGAILMSKVRQPKETAELLKKIYDARSTFVHEGKNLADLDKKVRDFTLPDKCESVVRDILSEYIKRMMAGQTLTQINQNLDESAINAA
jgi:Apea-like HEPN